MSADLGDLGSALGRGERRRLPVVDLGEAAVRAVADPRLVQFEELPWCAGGVVTDDDDLPEDVLDLGGAVGCDLGGAVDDAAEEPAGSVDAEESDDAQRP